ncbi:hypothetical protein N0M98_05870 [Paenibacillus doosanensis]|uniref:hypothetical protein n=1 Tax=Paenibacillus TaxID=44249 RepID=UPI00201D962E|nr:MULTISPECIES: hypothetical protein [Paenibacillus]MCS7459664.1 hypothetical protein [Paenibacillus doosanensis]
MEHEEGIGHRISTNEHPAIDRALEQRKREPLSTAGHDEITAFLEKNAKKPVAARDRA